MMRKGLWVCAACALAGAGALHVYLQRYEAEVAGGAAVPVLMVTRDLHLGELVTRGALDVKEVPERYLEERHIAADDLERVLGSRVTSALSSGGALLWSDLDTMQEGRTLSGLVRVGMRAYTLPAQDVSFEGLLRPGDRVDVLFVPLERAQGVETLLHNVLVLTVGRDLGQGEVEAGQERRARVTLSVTPAQAAALARREGLGNLRLSLRNPQDAVVEAAAQDAADPEPPPAGGHRAR